MGVHLGFSGDQEAAEKERPLPPLPRQVRQRSTCLLILMAILFTWIAAHLLDFYHIYSWNQRAPLVVKIRGFACALSPDRQYLTVLADTVVRGEDFFEVAGGGHIQIPRPATVPQEAEVYGLWLADDVYFNYHRWTDDETIGEAYRTKTVIDDIPEDGWLVDVSQRRAIELAQLDAAERERVLQLARELVQSYAERRKAALTSPDGRYTFRDGAVWDQAGNKVAETLLPDIARPCEFGWQADSSAIYFVDRERPPAADVGGAAGSIRLLPIPED